MFKAIELGLITGKEVSNYNVPINRYDMAKIIVKEYKEEYDDLDKYQGLINGMPDGTFSGKSVITRSQSVAVIARLINPAHRVVPSEVKIITVPISSSTKITTDKDILAICDKYKFGLMGLGNGPVFSYKKYEKPGFIEPIILITDNDPNVKQWLSISILNRNEYVGKDYKIKFECVSDPEYVKNTEWETIVSYISGKSLPYSYTSESGKEVVYEFSISNGSTTKIYPFSITLGGGVNE